MPRARSISPLRSPAAGKYRVPELVAKKFNSTFAEMEERLQVIITKLGAVVTNDDVAESALLVEKVRGVAVAGVGVAIQGLKLRLLAA